MLDLMSRDKTHVEWVKAWVQVLTEMQAYVKQHHTTGLTWNMKGWLVQVAVAVPVVDWCMVFL